MYLLDLGTLNSNFGAFPLDISNIYKNYGSTSKLVMYRRPYVVSPPTCRVHVSANCQICWTRGAKDGGETPSSSLYRSKSLITDYCLANTFTDFITLTIDPQKLDSHDFDLCKKKTSLWLNNQKKLHSPDLAYVLVAEKHKSGAIHFHILAKNYNGKLEVAVNSKTGRKVTKNGKQIYNLTGWRYGHSTLSKIQDSVAVSYYVQKYITKELISEFNKKRFWASRNLIKPSKSYNIDPSDLVGKASSPLGRNLYESDYYYLYTLNNSFLPQKQQTDFTLLLIFANVPNWQLQLLLSLSIKSIKLNLQPN